MHYSTKTTLPVAVAFALWSTAAHADRFTDAVVDRYQELGFDYIEVKEGINQLKVEAILGSQKYEVIYDRETGEILKQETGAADLADIGSSGVEIDREHEDFLDDDDFDDDDDEDDFDDEDEGEDEDDDDDDSDDDDGDDEDDDEDDSDDDDDDD